MFEAFETAENCPNSSPNCPQRSKIDSKMSKLPHIDTNCLKIVQKVPLIFLKVPKIAPIVSPIVPNVPKNDEDDPIVNNYPTENYLAHQQPSRRKREGQRLAPDYWRPTIDARLSLLHLLNLFCVLK